MQSELQQRAKQGDGSVGIRRNNYTVPDDSAQCDELVQVHSQLTAFFGTLTHHLPESCRRLGVDHPATGPRSTEPDVQWVVGCWDQYRCPNGHSGWQLSELTADETSAQRKNRQLRFRLCERWEGAIKECQSFVGERNI